MAPPATSTPACTVPESVQLYDGTVPLILHPTLMDTAQIEAAFRDWWIDSYNRPPNPQAVMTHVAFAEHVLALMELLEVADD
jgi:hypothetical protein